MNNYYREEYLFESVECSFLSIISASALDLYLHRFGKSHVYPNLTDIKLSSGHYFSKELQLDALQKNALLRLSISCGLRGVFSAMYEVMKNNNTFKDRVNAILGDDKESFFSLVNLLRNVYSHEITWATSGAILLKKDDYEGFVKYREKKGIPLIVSLDIKYSKILPDSTFPDGYGIKVDVYLDRLVEGRELTSVISLYDQQMIAELCFNLCKLLSTTRNK